MTTKPLSTPDIKAQKADKPKTAKEIRKERITKPRQQSDFIKYYNDNIPTSFPKATPGALREFKASHSSLFDDVEGWVIEKHRKRLMDWLSGRVVQE